MKLTQVTILLTILLTLCGCGFKEVSGVDIDEATLYSPEGEFKFKQNKKSFIYRAFDGNHSIMISLFPTGGKSSLWFYSNNVTIKSSGAYYQLNDGQKTKLIINRSWDSHKFFDIISPETMDYYISDGDGLHVKRNRQRVTSEHINKVKHETYRYYIPFTIDGKDYAIDVTFQLEINSRLRFGVPGMP